MLLKYIDENILVHYAIALVITLRSPNIVIVILNFEEYKVSVNVEAKYGCENIHAQELNLKF